MAAFPGKAARAALLAAGLAVLAASAGGLAARAAGSAALIVVLAAAGVALAPTARAALARPSRRAFLGGLAAAALALRVGWAALAPSRQVSDFAVYQELAASLASGLGYAIAGPAGREDLTLYLGAEGRTPPYATSYRAPGTAFIGAALYRLLGPDPSWMRLLNAGLGASTSLLLYLLLSGEGLELEGRLAGALWAAYPSAVAATGLFCSEVPFTAALVGLAWLASRSARRAGVAADAAAGALAAAALLIRPLWPALLPAWLAAVAAASPARAARKAAVFAAVLALGLAPWAWRNTRLWGRFTAICTDTGVTLAYHTARLLPESGPDFVRWRRDRAQLLAIPNEADKDARGYELGTRHLAAVLRAGPLVWWMRLLPCFGDTFGDDDELLAWAGEGLTRADGAARRALAAARPLNAAFYLALWALLCLAAWTDSPAWRRLPAGAVFLLLELLAVFAFSTFLPGQPRYHFPLMPAVALLAACGAAPRKTYSRAPSEGVSSTSSKRSARAR